MVQRSASAAIALVLVIGLATAASLPLSAASPAATAAATLPGAAETVRAAGRGTATTSRARSADAFVDSIGVNTHLHYTDTVYDRFDTLIAPRLRELGIRHIRDGAYTYDDASADTFYYRRLRELGRAGIRANLITSIATSGSARTDLSKLDEIRSWTGGAIEAFEGANEPDLNGGTNWVDQTRRLQRDLHEAVRGEPALRGVDVIGPSAAFAPDALGDLSDWIDYGNWHPYPGGHCPTCADVYGQSFDTRIARYRAPFGDQPMVVTETGYHNATAGTQDHRPTSERAAGRYLPRLFLEHFDRGVPRTYLYELIDQHADPTRRDREAHFGLLRNDGSRKPAFVAIRDLITLLEDPGPPVTTPAPPYTLDGATDDVGHILLAKRDGSSWLALWREVASYDTGQRANQPDAIEQRGDIAVPARTVTVSTQQPMARARSYTIGHGSRPQQTWTDTAAFTVNVDDEVTLLELRPSESLSPRRTDLSDTCDGVTRGVFDDVPVGQIFAVEIDCLHAWRVTRGTGARRRYAPGRPVQRWQMAVLVDRLAALEQQPDGDRATHVAPDDVRDRGYGDVARLSPEARLAIARMSELRVIKGTTATTFAPFDRVTRAQTAALLNRLRTAVTESTNSTDSTDHFRDDDGSVHERDINAIAELGIVVGTGGRRFRPGAVVRRDQMAAMLVRLIQTRIDSGYVDPNARRH